MRFRSASCLAIAVMALAAAAPAMADPVVNTTFLFLQPDAGFGQNAPFNDSFAASGTTFIDDFLFNSPPPRAGVSFSFQSSLLAGSAEISFTDFTLAPFQPRQTPVPVELNAFHGASSGHGSTLAPLDSGVYVLEIAGQTLADNAAFNGTLNALIEDPVAAVPEPGTWGLMAAGLGVVGASARRRRQQAA